MCRSIRLEIWEVKRRVTLVAGLAAEMISALLPVPWIKERRYGLVRGRDDDEWTGITSLPAHAGLRPIDNDSAKSFRVPVTFHLSPAFM